MEGQEEAKSPKEMRSVGKALNNLATAHEKLSSVLESFEKKLNPIMSLAEETPSDKTERPSMNCKLAEEIECEANKAENLVRQLINLRSRVEL